MNIRSCSYWNWEAGSVAKQCQQDGKLPLSIPGYLCPLRGCTPKLVNAAELTRLAPAHGRKGFPHKALTWSALMRFKEHSPSLFPQREEQCRPTGIAMFGQARLSLRPLFRWVMTRYRSIYSSTTGAKPGYLVKSC